MVPPLCLRQRRDRLNAGRHRRDGAPPGETDREEERDFSSPGEPARTLRRLRKDLKRAAKMRDFERAAKMRDWPLALEKPELKARALGLPQPPSSFLPLPGWRRHAHRGIRSRFAG